MNVKLPEGFEVDELPDSSKIESPFGTFEVKSVVANGVLTFVRLLSVKSIVVPAEDYPKLKAFSDQVSGADQAPIVLAKK